MATFIVEEYAVEDGASRLEASVARVLAAGEALALEGRAVVHQRSILLVDDQVALHVVQAASAEDVAEAARRAGIGCDRLHTTVEALSGAEIESD
jgi:hypothetical protein